MSGIVNSTGARSGVIGTITSAPVTAIAYEEGTWTPTLKDESGNLATLSTSVGTYTKIGRQVVANYRWTISSLGSMTGSYIIMAGLPYNHPSSRNGTGIVERWNGCNADYVAYSWDTAGGDVDDRVWLTGAPETSPDECQYVPAVGGIAPIDGNETFKGTIVYHT